jgi:hypothetical protein
MIFLSASRVQAWLAEHVPGVDAAFPSAAAPGASKLGVGRDLAAHIPGHGRVGVVVWVRDLGEDPWERAIYDLWRRARGGRCMIEDEPGHLFLPHEADDLRRLLEILAEQGWGFTVASAGGGLIHARGRSPQAWKVLRA